MAPKPNDHRSAYKSMHLDEILCCCSTATLQSSYQFLREDLQSALGWSMKEAYLTIHEVWEKPVEVSCRVLSDRLVLEAPGTK